MERCLEALGPRLGALRSGLWGVALGALAEAEADYLEALRSAGQGRDVG